MSGLKLTDNKFNPDGYWSKPIGKMLFLPTHEDVALFDQNGYALTQLEQHFARSNMTDAQRHRDQRTLKVDWFTQSTTIVGCTLNHSFLSERKGYTGQALKDLEYWAKELPLIYKIIDIRPKWGLDFSMDYVDTQGNSFEVLHWEWDSFDYDEISNVKEQSEQLLNSIDWQDASSELLKLKDQWYHLDFFAQSKWKCKYFGIRDERFKMVIWK